MRPTTRIQPLGPAQAYKTYQVLAPLSTHFRSASCAEVDCPAHLNGWSTTVDMTTELGQQQADYIRRHSGRHFTGDIVGNLVTFTFAAGQECFREHHLPLDRPAIFLVKDGDWRMSQNPRQHTNADDWVDDFANHQDALKTRLERG